MKLSKPLNILAQTISVMFHPLLISTLACFLVFSSGHYIGVLDNNIKLSIYFIFFVMTFVIPALFIPVLFYFKVISDIQMDVKKDRAFTLFIIGIMYALSYYFMSRVLMPDILLGIVLAASCSILLCMIISMVYKISLHTCGVGGVLALLIFLFTDYNLDIRFYLLIAILGSGLVGSARLCLNKHRIDQVLLGYVLGFACVFIVLKYF